jgi:transcriptional regulator GlxA family with amidase domain
LLLDNFTLISLASAVEPLRMANQLSGRELYRWTTLECRRRPGVGQRRSANHPRCLHAQSPALDTVIVCGGVGIQRTVTREHVSWLQSQARQSRRLGAVCTGSWALACAGLLDGFDCSVHWECLARCRKPSRV